MESDITQFVQSEMGFIFAIGMIVVGLADLASGIYIMRHRPDLMPLPPEKIKTFMTAIYFIASLLVLTGFYMLYLRI